MLLSIFQSIFARCRHPLAHHLARELDVNAVRCNEVTSRRYGPKSPCVLRKQLALLIVSLVLPTTSLPLHSSIPMSSESVQHIHTVLLPLDDPAQHHNRLVVCDLGPKVALTLALYLSQMAFLSSFKCVSGHQP